MGRLVLPPILIDRREQLPYDFNGYATESATLASGDYSLAGYDTQVAVERKTKTDAWACCGSNRDRFTDCLLRLSALQSPCVVIEASLDEFAQPPLRTRLNAAQAVGSYISWSAQYRIPVFWCPSRAYAERVTLRWLMAWWKHFGMAQEAKSA